MGRTALPKAGSSLPPSQKGKGKGSSLPPSQKGRAKGTSLPPSQKSAADRIATEYHEAVPRGSSTTRDVDPNFGFQRDVADVMRIATFAHRNWQGDLIWLTWVPNKQKPTRIGHGSACLLVTQYGFGKIKDAADRGLLPRGHLDLVLRDWLLIENEARLARASYVYPPIGSYTEHASECDPELYGGDKTRPSGFESGENPCHGTRLAGDPKGRWKCLYQWNGPKWGDKLETPFPEEDDLHGEVYVWRSRAEPTACTGPYADWKDWGDWGSNPGSTERQKRAFRAFNTRLTKRIWVRELEQAR